MITKGPISRDLNRLNKLYKKSLEGNDVSVPIYCSKLAVLELAGWVEESFDQIAYRAAKNRILSQKFQTKVDTAVNNNHGLSYTKNFLPMIIKIIGLVECEQLCAYLDSDGSSSVLDSELGGLLPQRGSAAHVNLANTTINFDSPSISIRRLNRVYPILKDTYSWFF